MKTQHTINKNKVPSVIIDESLDKYNNVILFPEQVRKAKETIDRIGLPKMSKNKRTIESSL